MFNTPLCQIAFKYGTDKCPQIKHHFTEVYYERFKDRTNDIKKVLEIGVGDPEEMSWTGNPYYQTGASLKMWRDFFPNAQVFGADIESRMMFEDDRIKTFLCDQTKEADLKNLIDQVGSDIDIVIEDGLHTGDSQVFTCSTLMPLLDKGVTYVIEDVGNLNIMERLSDYDCYYKRFRQKACNDDRLVIIKHKNV